MHPGYIQDGCFGWELTKSIGSFEQNYFTAKEFDAILNHLAKGTVFEKAKTDKTEVYKTAIDPIKMLSHVMYNEVTNKTLELFYQKIHFIFVKRI
jgi:type I restriction enzyme R subunit